jgi:type 1 glutamine amidotransferase
MRSALVVVTLVAACGDNIRDPADEAPRGVVDFACTGQPGKPRVLVYTYENQWRHLSNLAARAAIADMCMTRGFSVDATNDVHAVSARRLADHDVLVFAVTSGSGLDATSKRDVERWVLEGGGIVGIHSASATEQGWAFYVDRIGPQFADHAPGLMPATVDIDTVHPITVDLAPFSLNEEWYVFDERPEQAVGVTPLLSVDESTLPASYPADLRQGYHAIGWTTDRGGGRTFYTALGHNPDSYSDPTFLEIIGRAIEWTARSN